MQKGRVFPPALWYELLDISGAAYLRSLEYRESGMPQRRPIKYFVA